MNWYAIVFTHTQLSRLDYSRVEDEFQLSFLNAGSPAGMGLFALKTFPLHPVYYVSPAGVRYVMPLLREFDAIQCKEPLMREVELIAGEYPKPLEIQLQTLAQQAGRAFAHQYH